MPKIRPALLFIIVVLAAIFFLSGLLHLLTRFITRHRSSSTDTLSDHSPDLSNSETYQRQLQQLFNLHDSGLDQAFIDALPVFQYHEIKGLNEPFDCAVCLSQFSEQDQLRLLPLCSHAFHIDCIDTWLLSNSTCPLCRGALYTPGISVENPIFDFDDWGDDEILEKPNEVQIVGEKKMVLPVRLGKFRSSILEGHGGVRREKRGGDVGETSSNLDARRCFSMGSYQYVVAESELRVALSSNRTDNGCEPRIVKGGSNEGFSFVDVDGDHMGKKINMASKKESFSVSKIWLWSKKGQFPGASPNIHTSDHASVDVKFPWTNVA